jgi:hypothetical protein
MVIPLTLLNQIDQRRCEWLVPGLATEKTQLYLKSLPQKLRRYCVPIPDYAKKFVEQLRESGHYARIVCGYDKNKQRSLSITLYSTSFDGLPDVGEDIQALEGTEIKFGGNIKDVKFIPITPAMGTTADIACQIYSDGYNGIPQRRTINVLYTAKVNLLLNPLI